MRTANAFPPGLPAVAEDVTPPGTRSVVAVLPGVGHRAWDPPRHMTRRHRNGVERYEWTGPTSNTYLEGGSLHILQRLLCGLTTRNPTAGPLRRRQLEREPGPDLPPLSLDGRDRHAEDLSDLVVRQSAEEAQLDESSLSWIEG